MMKKNVLLAVLVVLIVSILLSFSVSAFELYAMHFFVQSLFLRKERLSRI